MYKLDETVGVQIKDNAIAGRKTGRNTLFPGQTFSIFIVQFLFIGVLTGILFRLLKPKDGGSGPEYH